MQRFITRRARRTSVRSFCRYLRNTVSSAAHRSVQRTYESRSGSQPCTSTGAGRTSLALKPTRLVEVLVRVDEVHPHDDQRLTQWSEHADDRARNLVEAPGDNDSATEAESRHRDYQGLGALKRRARCAA